jgi:hypothetical protein
MFVTLPIEQLVGRFDNVIAGCLVAHENTSHLTTIKGIVGVARFGSAVESGWIGRV